ncbi:condensation domain-containing protein [Streptomyces sp. NRRL S-31]|uniref:condensation domain-containing protein n=1 Tax=Streptomyces sp. NRRL S-31 TaxID=1463898 RepID=UPI0004C73164|nr:condensation domain-containing protein [Streptomyces sp. NRRL S-31]
MKDPVEQMPLSVDQEAMWIAWQRDPGQGIHIIPSPFPVRGTIDPACLGRAVDALGRSFPRLRGRVAAGARGPVLDWSDAPRIPVRESTTPLARDEAVRHVRQVPFDLDHGPLARVELLHGPDYTVLVLAVHHLVSDEASVLILADALRRAHAGEPLPAGDPVPAPRAFADRSREAADTPAGEAHRTYRRRPLGQDAPVPLPPRSVDEPAYTTPGDPLPAGLVARPRLGESSAADHPLHDPARAPAGSTAVRRAALVQERLWSAAPDGRHGLSVSLRLSRLPDDEALQEAVHRVTLAHDALRTHLGLAGNQVVQHVRTGTAVTPVRLPVRPSSGSAEVPDPLRDWAAEPFDLARGPLFRIAVLPERSGGGWLSLAGHRAVLDEWSLRLVARQLLAALDDAAPAEPSSFPDWLDDTAPVTTAEELAARAAELSPAAEALGLPGRRPRQTDTPEQEYEEGVVTFAVPRERAVREAAERLGVGHRDLLLAAFAALLGRYTGRQDLLVGVAHHARLPSDRHVVGPLATVLPVRLRPEAGEDLATLATRTAAEVAKATAHSGIPAEELMRLVDPSRTDRTAPPTEVLFDCDDHDGFDHGGFDHGGFDGHAGEADRPRPDVPGCADGAVRAVVETSGGQDAYDVALLLRHRSGRIEGRLAFDARYFDHDQMHVMAEDYLRLIERFVETPGRAVGETDRHPGRP